MIGSTWKGDANLVGARGRPFLFPDRRRLATLIATCFYRSPNFPEDADMATKAKPTKQSIRKSSVKSAVKRKPATAKAAPRRERFVKH